MYTSFVLYLRSLILLCGLGRYMRWIVILSLCVCNGISTYMVSAIRIPTISVLSVSIVRLCQTFFVVRALKSAVVATCMQTGSSQYVTRI